MDLKSLAKDCRKSLVLMKTRSGVGHLASSLSLVEILISLYLDDETYFDHTSDTLIFGKAHGGPALYPILATLKYYDDEELGKYGKSGGILKVHPDQTIPGCTFVGGSLGNALGYSAGLAYADREGQYVCILGDAELYEGAIWESLLFIAHHKLANLLIIVDRNEFGILGKTEELLKLEPLRAKFESFGYLVKELDGHSFTDLQKNLNSIPEIPTILIARTIKGRGISFMEAKAEYHTIIPKDKETVTKMLEELND